MKVSELIEELKKFNGDLDIKIGEEYPWGDHDEYYVSDFTVKTDGVEKIDLIVLEITP